MTVTIKLTDDEKRLVNNYAKLHSISIDEAFKGALFEKIEDEHDISVADEAHAEWEKNAKKTKSIEELWKELDI